MDSELRSYVLGICDKITEDAPNYLIGDDGLYLERRFADVVDPKDIRIGVYVDYVLSEHQLEECMGFLRSRLGITVRREGRNVLSFYYDGNTKISVVLKQQVKPMQFFYGRNGYVYCNVQFVLDLVRFCSCPEKALFYLSRLSRLWKWNSKNILELLETHNRDVRKAVAEHGGLPTGLFAEASGLVDVIDDDGFLSIESMYQNIYNYFECPHEIRRRDGAEGSDDEEDDSWDDNDAGVDADTDGSDASGDDVEMDFVPC